MCVVKTSFSSSGRCNYCFVRGDHINLSQGGCAKTLSFDTRKLSLLSLLLAPGFDCDREDEYDGLTFVLLHLHIVLGCFI